MLKNKAAAQTNKRTTAIYLMKHKNTIEFWHCLRSLVLLKLPKKNILKHRLKSAMKQKTRLGRNTADAAAAARR